MSINKIVIIGAGAAGLTAAGILAKTGADVTLLERNKRPARKLMITGKGRCNLTNLCDRNEFISAVVSNGRFLYSAFSGFSSEDTIALFKDLGVKTKVERGNRVFPVSDKAVDVVDALVDFACNNGAKILEARATNFHIENGNVTKVLCEDGQAIPADIILIATGGKSYPATGSTGDGYTLAKTAGHSIIPPSPSLVPLIIKEGYAAEMQGLSLKNIAISAEDVQTGKTTYKDFGELIFTHFGLSGPVVLSASAHLRPMIPERYRIYIDLKPALDLKTLDNRLTRIFTENASKDFCNSLDSLLPKKMIPTVIRLSGIEAHIKCNQVTKEERAAFAALLKQLPFTIMGFRPIEEAVVTSGGVKVSEIEPKTMRSKLCENLYFAGEVIDVDAYTGGFNLQIAFSTAVSAARAISERINREEEGQ